MPNTSPPPIPPRSTGATDDSAYASWGRRILALILDWAACQAVAYAIVQGDNRHGASFLPLGLFLLESGVGVALVGGSFGQMLTRLRVRRLDGRPVELLPALLRSLLICLVIPPLVFKPDGRGLHDLAVGTATFPLVDGSAPHSV